MSEAASPAISVIMATHNRSRALAVAIASVRQQDFTDWELIVVADACTDDSEAVVGAFADSRIRYVALARNFGEQAGPNNIGVAHARAPLVAFLNHDDLWLPDHLSSLRDFLLGTCADLVFSCNANVGPSSRFGDGYDGLAVYIDALTPRGTYTPRGPHQFFAPCSTWLMRRALHRRLGGFKLAADCFAPPTQELLFRAHRSGFRLRNLPHLTVIVLASGERRGAYVENQAREQEWFLPRLPASELRTELLARASNPARRLSTRLRAWGTVLTWLGALGFDPQAIDHRLRRRERRGDYIRALRRVRGLDADTARGSMFARVRLEASKRASRPVSLGEDLRINSREGVAPLGAGFSWPEPWGVWTDGPYADLVIRLAQPSTVPLRVCLFGQVFFGPHCRVREIDVQILGERVAAFRVKPSDVRTPLELIVPVRLLGSTTVVLQLHVRNPISPLRARVSGDRRELGYGLEGFRVSAEAVIMPVGAG